jgi:hypothetical protein
MRTKSNATERGFEAKAISGTHTILIALNCSDAIRKGLKGFAFEREIVGAAARVRNFSGRRRCSNLSCPSNRF